MRILRPATADPFWESSDSEEIRVEPLCALLHAISYGFPVYFHRKNIYYSIGFVI